MDVDFKQFRSTTKQMTESFATDKLKDKEDFAQSFHVLLNYWEIKPAQYEAKLHELALKDVRVVCAFVPWSHVETDIYHSLKKFIRAAYTVRLKVKLYVMPELGVNYPNCGVPRELLQSNANLAVGRRGQVIYNYAAPNIFALPSFFSPDVVKRFGNYLIKFGSILAEVFHELGNSDFCEIIVSNTFFNYYRNYGLKAHEHGDYSAAHVMSFREFLDREYPGGSGEPFKMQVYEPLNRHRFFSHVEKTLREKTEMIFSRKNSQCALRHMDLVNPECSPDMGYQSLMVELFDFKPSAQRFYDAIVAAGDRGEKIFINGSGIFRRFSDQEKCFLIMASLIHTGEVIIPHEEVERLPVAFQKKFSDLSRVLKNQSYIPHRRLVYLSVSKFAMDQRCYGALSKMAPGVVSISTAISSEASDSARHYSDTATGSQTSEHTREAMRFHKRLIFVDPKSVLRMIDLVQLLSLAQSGKVVAIPAPYGKLSNYLPDALNHIDKLRKIKKPLKINLGVAYEVYEYQLGFVVIYDSTSFWDATVKSTDVEAAGTGLPLFFQALLGLAEIRSVCQVNDPRIHVVSYVSESDSQNRLLFLVNSACEEVNAKLQFSETVGLASIPLQGTDGKASECIVGKSFELAVPPLGVLSMQLRDPDLNLSREEGTALPWN